MRDCGIALFVLLILIGCKTTVPTSGTAKYSEDLSVHRPFFEKETIPLDSIPIQNAKFTPLRGHIKAELDSIIRIDMAQNQEGKLVDGYILQIYTGNNRNEANEARAKMDRFFPDLESKISYRQPNFQVRAGKFTDRLTAFRTLQQVKEAFPKALLVPSRFTLIYD